MKWLAIVVAALALAPAADAAKRARPDAAAAAAEQIAPNAIQVFNDYVTPARAYASQRAVVHYVALGVSAPPLNDDDADGVPDYVERVGDAADTAIAYYERRGFAAILADAGGPDARPDLYVSRFAAGYFGVAFPAADADGGGVPGRVERARPEPGAEPRQPLRHRRARALPPRPVLVLRADGRPAARRLGARGHGGRDGDARLPGPGGHRLLAAAAPLVRGAASRA